MSDEAEVDLGCFGCLIAVALLFVCVGAIGLAWKFMLWAWS